MDFIVKMCSTGDKGTASLNEAFYFMKNVAETRPSIDSPDSFGQDLYVICAEIAFQVNFLSLLEYYINQQVYLLFYFIKFFLYISMGNWTYQRSAWKCTS